MRSLKNTPSLIKKWEAEMCTLFTEEYLLEHENT